jgi:hypothetical protein
MTSGHSDDLACVRRSCNLCSSIKSTQTPNLPLSPRLCATAFLAPSHLLARPEVPNVLLSAQLICTSSSFNLLVPEHEAILTFRFHRTDLREREREREATYVPLPASLSSVFFVFGLYKGKRLHFRSSLSSSTHSLVIYIPIRRNKMPNESNVQIMLIRRSLSRPFRLVQFARNQFQLLQSVSS